MVGDVSERLLPYVPRLVVDWLRDQPTVTHRRVEGTLAFCDVSGFTALTERLASGGKAGAEEMGDILNTVFTELLVPAYDQGAALLKYGGDAVLLVFQGDGHAVRACRSAWSMQAVMRRIGGLRTSVGPAQLRMSIGVHSGPIDFFLAGTRHRELVVTGPTASRVAQLEAAADAGEVLVSEETAAELSRACIGAWKAPGWLLAGPPGVSPFETFPVGEIPDLTTALSPEIVAHVVGGWTGSEHRVVVPGFLQFRGLDDLLEERGAAAIAGDLDRLVDALVASCALHGVTFIGTDIAPDGGKAIVVGGAPRAAPDSESRVLLALLDTLKTGSALRLRAGCASGRVFCGDYGPPYRRTYSGIGDAVNLAARLAGKAGDGQLLASKALLDATRTGFRVEAVPPFLVKGKSEAVEAVIVHGVQLEPSVRPDLRSSRLLPFVGRANEMAAMSLTLAALRAGSGCALHVVGMPGAGKSRLLEETFRDVEDCARIALTCDVYSSVTPYSIARRLVVEALRLRYPEVDALSALHLTCDDEPALAPWLPLLGALLGAELPITPEVRALDERFRQRKLIQVVVELLAGLWDSSTVVTVDDVHLADEASRALLDELASVADDHPWLVVMTQRPAADVATIGPVEGDCLWLAPLDEGELRRALLAATEDSALPVHEVEQIAAHAGGNPLHAVELLNARLAGDLSLTDGLEALVAARIDRLPSGPRHLLRVASVCGMVVDPTLISEVLRSTDADEALIDWAQLEPFLTWDGSTWRFREAVVRDTAYEALPFTARRALHGAVADAMLVTADTTADDALALLSFHFSSAQRWPEAVRWSREAGVRAERRLASLEAARFYDRALAAARRLRPAPRGELACLALAAGRAWFAVGENDRSLAALKMHPSGGEVHSRVEVGMWLARIRLRTGGYTQGLRQLSWVERQGALLPSDEAAVVRAEVLAQRAFVRHMQGREREAVRWAEQAVEVAAQVEAKAALAQALQVLDWAHVGLGEFDAGAHAERALELWQELGDLGWQGRVLVQLGIRGYYTGDWRAALERYAQAREVFDRAGDLWGASVCAGNIAEIYVEQGRLEEALEPTRLALRAAKVAGARSFIALWTAQLGRIAIREGRSAEGLELLREAEEIYTADGEVASALTVQAQIAAGLALAGHCAQSLATARTALEQLPKVPGAGEAEPLLQRARGFALVGLGRREEAAAAFRESLAAARARSARRDIALGLDALIRHAEAPLAQQAEWATERDALVELLGIEQLGAAGAEAAAVPIVPEQVTAAASAESVLAG